MILRINPHGRAFGYHYNLNHSPELSPDMGKEVLSVSPQELHPHLCSGEDARSADLDHALVPLHSQACVTWDKFPLQTLLSDQLFSLFIFQEQLSVSSDPTLTVEHMRYQRKSWESTSLRLQFEFAFRDGKEAVAMLCTAMAPG